MARFYKKAALLGFWNDLIYQGIIQSDSRGAGRPGEGAIGPVHIEVANVERR